MEQTAVGAINNDYSKPLVKIAKCNA